VEQNLLYYGDNLDVMRRHVGDESVDLVYLDPPFKSNVTYNVLFEEHGTGSAAQIRAFDDTWEWNEDSSRAYQETVEQGGAVANALVSFRNLLGGSDMLAYLAMMAPRLVELRRVMKADASLFLHCDPTASHYLKLLLDAVFGQGAYRNEIIWHYFNKLQGNVHKLAADHDTIFWYSKGREFAFHPVMEEREGGPKRMLKRRWDQANQRLVNVKDEAGHVEYISRTHRMADDVWRMPMLQPASREKLGYPTQKPFALLARLLAMASDPGDVVLDPFCGCGTALDAAQALDRRWVGIDITHLAIGLIKSRLVGRYGPAISDTYRVVGEPVSVDDARVLARDDPFQFQAWALGLVGARPAGETKKGGDQGIDGRLYFHDEGPGGTTKQIIVSVKAGHLVPNYVRDLIGTIDNEGAQIGVLLSFQPPTAGMVKAAASAGFYKSPWGDHPRIQLLTVGDLLDGARINYPPANVTFRQAEQAGPVEAESMPLFDE
jgi:DNA modification methylase